MNTRQKEILFLLLSELDEYLLMQDLANRVNCSEKTIRNDFKVIEHYLVKYPSALLVRKPGLGVYLEIEEHEKVDLFNKLYRVNHRTKYESDEERILQMAYNLLMNVKAVTARDMASQYFVNRATIKKDLDKLEKWELNGLASLKQQKAFLLVSVIEGEGELVCKGEKYVFKKGDHFILPNEFGEYKMVGNTKFIILNM
ncbi:hypothetical protein [Bacillus bingmayongensis]|uniref:hypothetical protein n=1 Tax=Bacillus bingmayongensis TaxID=1150157 RepID=UPI0035AB986D